MSKVHTHVCDIPFMNSTAMHSYIVRNKLHADLPNRAQFVDAMCKIAALHKTPHMPNIGRTRISIEFYSRNEASSFLRGFNSIPNLKGLTRICRFGKLVTFDFLNSKTEAWCGDVKAIEEEEQSNPEKPTEVELLRQEIKYLAEAVHSLTKQVKALNKSHNIDLIG